jgi:N-acetylglucosamine-6-phosphate deacetylase
MEFAVIADHVFDGATLRRDCAVVIEGPRIRCVIPRDELSASIPARHLPQGTWLAPGFIDTQVNGGGDVLFNDDPSPRAIAAIAAAHRRFGTTALLPALLTDTQEKMRAARDAVETAAGLDPSISGSITRGRFCRSTGPACMTAA